MERLLQGENPICARFFTNIVVRRSQGTLGEVCSLSQKVFQRLWLYHGFSAMWQFFIRKDEPGMGGAEPIDWGNLTIETSSTIGG